MMADDQLFGTGDYLTVNTTTTTSSPCAACASTKHVTADCPNGEALTLTEPAAPGPYHSGHGWPLVTR